LNFLTRLTYNYNNINNLLNEPNNKPQVQNLLIRYGCIYSTEFNQDTGYAKIKRYKIKNCEVIKERL